MWRTHIIRSLRCLIQRNQSCCPSQLRRNLEGFAKLNSVGAIKPTGAIVPALHCAPTQHGLRNADSLPFAPRNTLDQLAANISIRNCCETKCCHGDVFEPRSKSSAGNPENCEIRWCSCGSSKRQCLVNRQLWKVHVLLGHVDGFATELTVHLVGWDALVVDVGVF